MSPPICLGNLFTASSPTSGTSVPLRLLVLAPGRVLKVTFISRISGTGTSSLAERPGPLVTVFSGPKTPVLELLTVCGVPLREVDETFSNEDDESDAMAYS